MMIQNSMTIQEIEAQVRALMAALPETPPEDLETVKQKLFELKQILCARSQEFHRGQVVQYIVNAIHAQTYLEIGVNQGEVFSRIAVAKKIGVDPIPMATVVSPIVDNINTYYYQMTSDDFFRDHATTICAEKVDLVFIDGLHTYEQSRADVLNALPLLSKKGVIVMHDCSPTLAVMATPATDIDEAGKIAEQNGHVWTGAWCGDVWKTVVYLRSQIESLNVRVLNCDCGVGILTQNPSAQKLPFSPEDIQSFTFDDLEKNRIEWLNLVNQDALLDMFKMDTES